MEMRLQMDEKQAEATARAILEHGRQAQAERRRGQANALQARSERRFEQRLIGGFGMLGLVVAVAMAFFVHKNMLAFVGTGAPAGIVAGSLVVSWRRVVLRSNHFLAMRARKERATQASSK